MSTYAEVKASIETCVSGTLPVFHLGDRVTCTSLYTAATVVGRYDDNGYPMYIIQYPDYNGSARKLAAGPFEINKL